MAAAAIAQMKTCTKCGVSKSVACFSKDKSRRGGLFPWCRECKGSAARDGYRRNPAPYIERAAQKRASDPGAMKAWREANADRIRSYNAQYYARDREGQRARYI